jgi:hypothetical protein
MGTKEKATTNSLIAVGALLVGVVIAGYFVDGLASGSSTPAKKEKAAAKDPDAVTRGLVERLPVNGVIVLNGEFQLVVAGRRMKVGEPIDFDSGIVFASVEHEATVGGPPVHPVVWFESKTGYRVARKLRTHFMLGPETPKKAPEPAPGSVTPRATSPISK